MKLQILHFFLITFLITLISCREKRVATHHHTSTSIDTSAIKYTLPVIPDSLKNTERAINYLIEHYWGSIDFEDTVYLHANDMMEQTWCNYCDLLTRVSPTLACRSMHQVIKSANTSDKMFKYITNLAKKYLYDPNSPMRNEELYIPVLQEMLTSSLLNKAEKIRPEAQLKLALKNRVGQKGGNFCYTLISGQKGYFYRIKADYVLLFFNNPDCRACHETIELLKKASTINRFFYAGKLKILSLYPDDEVDYWKQHIDEFPEQWIRAYDKEMRIRQRQIYDLKALPTLYLFDKNKKVLLKDVTPVQVEMFLQKEHEVSIRNGLDSGI